MRRLFAIMLIATSGWLLHQTVGFNFGGAGASFWTELARQANKPAFLIPTIGGALCLLGGLTVFFGGPGGAALALLGSVAVAFENTWIAMTEASLATPEKLALLPAAMPATWVP